jgi:C4-dicarboxylate-binding protein DctP
MCLRLIGSLLLLLLFAGTGLTEPISIKIAQSESGNITELRAVDYLIKLIEERSGGRIHFAHLPEPAGNEGLQALAEQRLQLVLLDTASLRKQLPLVEIFELPFLYADRAHLHQILDGEIGRQILQAFQYQGLKPLSYWDESYLQLAAGLPLLRPELARELQFDDQQSLLAKAFQGNSGESVGANTVVEISLTDLNAGQLSAAITDLTLSNHATTGALLLTSQDFWNDLPEDLKVIVNGAIRDTTAYARELMDQADRMALERQEASGRYRIHRLTPGQRSAWKNTLMQLYRQHFSEKELEFIESIFRS